MLLVELKVDQYQNQFHEWRVSCLLSNFFSVRSKVVSDSPYLIAHETETIIAIADEITF